MNKNQKCIHDIRWMFDSNNQDKPYCSNPDVDGANLTRAKCEKCKRYKPRKVKSLAS